MGACASSRHEEFSSSVGQFERALPFYKLSLQEYEERVKRLIFEDDNDEITMNQLIESFKDCPSFAQELRREGSDLRKVLLSKYLQKTGKPITQPIIDLNKPGSAQEAYETENRTRIWVRGLLLLGVLYCTSSDRTRANAFFEIVQEGLNEQIAATDRDIQNLMPRLLTLAVTMSYHFAAVRLGKSLEDNEELNEEQKLDEIYEEIYNEMLDEVFGENNQRLTRSEYIAKMSVALGRKYLSAVELRKVVDKKLNDKNIQSTLRDLVKDGGQFRVSKGDIDAAAAENDSKI